MWTTRETLSHLTRVRESKCDSEYKSICDEGRTPRGCVNRNLVANAICVDEPPLSHPARVRESKHYKCILGYRSCWSHPARVRESKRLGVFFRFAFDGSHPARVRESKSVAVVVDFNLTESHPTRVRESKSP